MGPQFDITGARKAGYSDEEIARFLGKSANFDVDGALKAGYSPADIIQRLQAIPTSGQQASTPGFLKRAWNALTEGVGNLGPASDWPEFGPNFKQQLSHIGQGIVGIPRQMGDALTKSGNSLMQGHPLESVYHAVGAVPGFGPAAQQVGQDVDAGNYPEALGHGVRLLGLAAAPEMARSMPELEPTLTSAGTVIKGVARGGWEGGTAPATLRVRGLPIELPVPASIAGAGTGAAAGEFFGGKPGALAGGAIGGLAPVVRGAIQGGREAYAALHAPPTPPPPDFLPGLPSGYGPAPVPPPPDFLPGRPSGYGPAPVPPPPDFLPGRPSGYGGSPALETPPDFLPGYPKGYPPPPIPPPPDFLPGYPEGYKIHPVDPNSIRVSSKVPTPTEISAPTVERPDMLPMTPAEAHRYAHAQATEAGLPGSPAGTSKGAHDWLSTQAKTRFGVKSWHELTPAQMQSIGDDLLETNRAKATAPIPPVK